MCRVTAFICLYLKWPKMVHKAISFEMCITVSIGWTRRVRGGGGPSMNSDKLFPLPSHPFINSVSFVRHRMNWAAIDFALCVQNNVSFTKEYSHASHSKVLVLFPWINHPHLWNPFHFTTQAHLSQWKEKSLNYFKLKSYLAWRGIKDHLPIL